MKTEVNKEKLALIERFDGLKELIARQTNEYRNLARNFKEKDLELTKLKNEHKTLQDDYLYLKNQYYSFCFAAIFFSFSQDELIEQKKELEFKNKSLKFKNKSLKIDNERSQEEFKAKILVLNERDIAIKGLENKIEISDNELINSKDIIIQLQKESDQILLK